MTDTPNGDLRHRTITAGYQAELSRPSRGSTPRTTEPTMTMVMLSGRLACMEGSLKQQAEMDSQSMTAPPAKKAKLPQPNNALPTEDWINWYWVNAWV